MGLGEWASAAASRARDLARHVTIEPVFLLFSFSQGLYVVIAQSLYIAKVCKVNLALGDEICDNLHDVQKIVATLQSYNGILQALPAIVYSLFAGPWSDSNGRKLLIVCATFGYVFNNAVFMINTHFFYELKAEYLLFECLQDCTGGYVCFFMGCYAYMTDMSDEKHRSKRLSFLDALWPVGYFVGMGLSGIIKSNLGFMYNFGLGMSFALLAMLYTVFFVKDSTKHREKRLREKRMLENPGHEEEEYDHKKHRTGLRSLFDLSNIREGVSASFRRREARGRGFIFLLKAAFHLDIFMLIGRFHILFLFFRRQLGWTAVEYSRYTTVLGVLGMFGQGVIVPYLTTVLGWRDTAVVLVNATGHLLNQLVVALSFQEWPLYFGAVVTVLGYSTSTMCRSQITKLVRADEVGKIFSVVGAFQAILPLLASPAFGFLYRATVETCPAAVLYVMAAGHAVEIALVLAAHIGLIKRDRILEERRAEAKAREAAKEEEQNSLLKEN